LTLTGSSAISGTGNALDNVLTGNGGNNTLTGGGGNDFLSGGLGNDTMVGGLGDDIYVVNVTTDVVTEAASEGLDTVQSAVTWTLGSNLEHLVLTGTGTISGTGNTLHNWLTGNSGNNTLTGNEGNDTLDGGLGNDTLVGGAGNDTYVVNVTTDVITEAASAGTDTVQASLTWTLATNLENLTLTGTSNLNGTGNTVANVLIGNGGSNTLTGLAGNDTLDGGLGNDTLVGSAGADTYRFSRGHGVDTVQDNDTTSGVTDLIEFGSGLVQSDLTFSKSGNHLVASINGTADQLLVQDWYLGAQYRVEEFRFTDGTVLSDTQVQGLISAMAGFSAGTSSGAVVPTMRVPSQDLVATSYI
jgi:Ca2+-binding RTX toxin-like protein